MPNRLHVWSLAGLVVALAGCGSRGCSSSNARGDRRSNRPANTANARGAGRDAGRVAPAPPIAPFLTVAMVDASVAQVGSVREGVNLLGVELFGRLRAAQGNVALSPTGVAASLAMVSGGARGETLAEMRRVLHHAGDATMTHQLLGEETIGWRHGDAGDAGDGGLMRFAHRLYAPEGLDYAGTFTDLTLHAYRSSFDRVDFRNADAAKAHINGWTSGQTDGRVEDVVPADGVTTASRMVLAGGLYLRVAWQRRFSLAQTRVEAFQGPHPAQAPMMHLAGSFQYVAAEGAKVVELPLRDGGLVMDVILPAEGDAFDTFEASLTASRVQSWIDALAPARVDVALPRFTVHPRVSTPFREHLEALGMTRAFDPAAADFSGVAAPRNAGERLALSAVYQRAIVEVSEYGDSGAAEPAARPGATVNTFRADRPFVFVVRDAHSGFFVALGRVLDPAG